MQYNINAIMMLFCFRIFGKLKGVRMPNKILGEKQHRGFGFVEFFAEENAKVS
jgi:RNA recognition motif-containing protein